MMKNFLKIFARQGLISGVLLLGLTAGASAAGYPEKPITMIVAYGPGGGTDLIARLIAPYVEKYLGNDARIVVSNRAGAGGAIGFTEISRATPDGYTIGFLNTPNLISIPIERQANYTWRGFDLIGNLVDDPGAFTVNSASPMKDLKDLVTYAKANPGKVTVGSTGVGSDDHLAMLFFERAAGVKMTHVPYKGSAEVRTGLLTGQLVVGAINVGEALQFMQGGAPMRMLGQMSLKRTNLATDTPTFVEQGFQMESASLRGLAAPKGLPADIREKLVKAVAQAAVDPGYLKQAALLFAPVRYLAPVAYEQELLSTEKDLLELWKVAPWKE
jgi:tripartite-type tricarboxylate transporter receptor subunit TctC